MIVFSRVKGELQHNETGCLLEFKGSIQCKMPHLLKLIAEASDSV